jgi:hypothetical protein
MLRQKLLVLVRLETPYLAWMQVSKEAFISRTEIAAAY